jgi:hypothetical protein
MAKKEPDAAGGATDPDNNGGGVTIDQVKELLATELSAMQKDVNKSITGAVTRQLAEGFKSESFVGSLSKAMNDMLTEREKAKEPVKQPSDIEALQTQVKTLSQQLQEEATKRSVAETKSREQSLDNGIMSAINALDGKEGRPNLRKDARDAVYQLIRTGYNLSTKPELSGDGKVVVKQLDGSEKSLGEILGNGYFGDGHWAIEKFAASGSGAHGAKPTGNSSSTSFDPKKYGTYAGNQELAEKYKGDPEGLLKAIQEMGKISVIS